MNSWKQLLALASLPYVWLPVIILAVLPPPVAPIGLAFLALLALSLFVWTKTRHRRALRRQMGDRQLLALTAWRLPEVATAMAIATVETSEGMPAREAFAYVNCSPETQFEIGSITKAITGMAIAATADTGTIDLDCPAIEELPFTFRELATHRSGLPRLPDARLARSRMILLALLQLNPYRAIPDHVIRDASHSSIERPPPARYSNLGGALAGIGLAQHRGTSVFAALRDTMLTPIGMNATAPTKQSRLEPDLIRGFGASGLPSAHWTMDGYLSAGGLASTAEDMTRLTGVLLAGKAPGVSSMVPVAEMSERLHVGLFWMTSPIEIDDEEYAMHWHNGGTGGFSSMLAVIPALGRGVVAMANASGGIDPIALDVLRDRKLWIR